MHSSPPSPSDSLERQALFVRLFTQHHRRLLGYVTSLVANRFDAEDVLQRTSLTLWRKFDTFDPATDFMAWATTVAFYEARNFLRMAGRSRLTFDEPLLELMAKERFVDLAQQSSRLDALHQCLQKLEAGTRETLHEIYLDGVSIADVAARQGRAVQTLYNKMNLTRRSLMDCIERTLANNQTI